MEVTPSTRKSHGATSSPSISMNGSTKPPMQASVWKLALASAARAASSGIGSITPWGYWGAEPTTSTVRSSMRSAAASTSARQSAPTGTLRTSKPEVVRGLVEGGVGAHRQDHGRVGDAPLAATAARGRP